MRNGFTAATVAVILVLVAVPRGAIAQRLPAMGPPIPTTIVVTKPAPEETFGGKTTVTMGVGDKVFKFILKDGFTSSLKTRWPDIWQYVIQYNPNFVVQGDKETFAKIQPGQTVTVSGMFAPMDRTFEVVTVDQGGGSERHY
jgi:hypothetical protein